MVGNNDLIYLYLVVNYTSTHLQAKCISAIPAGGDGEVIERLKSGVVVGNQDFVGTWQRQGWRVVNYSDRASARAWRGPKAFPRVRNQRCHISDSVRKYLGLLGSGC